MQKFLVYFVSLIVKKCFYVDKHFIALVTVLLHSKAQLIISILKDKIPEQVLNNSNIVLELSQNVKLFKV
ncbi:hypothetical protein HYD97_00865 [Mycoplasmopsis bovis]|nr:hypothetical protein [Mycoplasmopsis bovis]QQH34313.1 hypothetical protein HYD97_00865 [Mycoplasmopsis bovis]